jgi:hypothetical protein
MVSRLFGFNDFFRARPTGDQEGAYGRPETAPEIWGNAATMPAEQEPTDAGGLSRRQLVTRGAIAGGLVWAAPVIRTTAAYATTANGTEKPCQNFFMVVINPAGHVLPAPARIQFHTTPPAIRRWFRDNAGVTVQYPSRETMPQLTAVSDEEAAVLLPEVTGPNAAGRQCRMVLGYARKGETSFSEAFLDPDPPIAVAVGRRIIFPCPRESNSVTSSAVDSSNAVSDTTSTSTTTAVPSTSDPITSDPAVDSSSVAASGTPSGTASSTLGGDGSTGATLGSDGQSGPTLGSDGTRSNPGGGGHGNGHCFDSLYLIYCCPR